MLVLKETARMACSGGSLSCSLARDFEGSTSTRSEATCTRKSPTPVFPGSLETRFYPKAWICSRSSRICFHRRPPHRPPNPDLTADFLPSGPPPTGPADFASELAHLRVSVQDLQRERERDELRVQLQSDGRSEQRERKHHSRVERSTLVDHVQGRLVRAHGDFDQQCRVKFARGKPIQPVGVQRNSRYGSRGVRVGEAKNFGFPSPSRTKSDDLQDSARSI